MLSLRKSYITSGLDVSDMTDVPRLLRGVLEESLILEPSQQSLDSFLPKVGQIITDLMKILKMKQAEFQRVTEARKSSSTMLSVPETFPDSLSTPSSSHSAPSIKISPINNSQASSENLQSSSPNKSMLFSPSPKDPLARLQNNHALMRRASKRFSAYQTSKIISMNRTGTSSPVSGYTLPTTDEDTLTKSPNGNDPQPALPSSPLQEEVIKNIRESELDKTLSHSLIEEDDSSRTSQASRTTTVYHLPGGKGRIYLKIGNKVKKADLKLPTTLASIKVLFTQKFDYSPNGEIYPAIYIQETSSDVSYEMENVEDIQAGCILSLQQPDLATVICQHLDNKFGLMRDEISKIEKLTVGKPIDKEDKVDAEENSKQASIINDTVVVSLKREINELKSELIRARQQQAKTKDQLTDNVGSLLTWVQELQAISLSPTGLINNPYMDHCRTKVSSECELLVSRIDNLQDLIEVLKVDITKRRSRPSEKQVLQIQKELGSTKGNLESLTKYMVKERNNWNNRWQSELTAVLEEQEFFKEQETIVQLLGEDLGSADETFDLIVKCCEELAKNANILKGPRLPVVDPSVSMHDVKNMVLQEVESLNPDHGQRVDAILKAEKVRDMERKMLNKTAFEQELGDFVGNSKLKSNGGVDEVERQRKLKDEENLKSQFGGI
ncbi:hypothetical protein FOA43_003307 [Brettanomyces nanus]|uniref:Actin interacting protein 3 C-terminal domain-containing protein n=1 Tax=Eeniella nana TaxID=13502 RepID=A0A875S2H5_EENNA|nr:uncharacterized protein FOA43_003307 [Brettanomyces nanus]QPG75921.1 hypothetical protein FOA43_003307 [Brettanomyces nanus]